VAYAFFNPFYDPRPSQRFEPPHMGINNHFRIGLKIFLWP